MHPGVHAASTPDKPAIIMATSGKVITYRELNDESNRIAQLFWALGLRPGDAVALMMENHPRYFSICWAAQRSGLQYTAISSRLTPGEASYIVNDCGAKVFITSFEKRDVAHAIRSELPNVISALMVDGTIDGYESLEAAIEAQPAEPLAEELEGGAMLYSSGTTGRPKGVKTPLPLKPFGTAPGLYGLATALYGLTAESVYLSPAPFYHAAPLRYCMAVMRAGGTVVAMEHFDAEQAHDSQR